MGVPKIRIAQIIQVDILDAHGLGGPPNVYETSIYSHRVHNQAHI